MSLSIQPEEERSVTVRAPAKVNLHLGVGRPRGDGFHPLDTVFQAVGLYDDVRASDGEGTVTVEPAEYVPPGVLGDLSGWDDNIVGHAARLLSATAEDETALSPVDLVVVKRIPVAGGMAGGSADAAAALRGSGPALGAGDGRRHPPRPGSPAGQRRALLAGRRQAHGTGRGEVLHPIPDTTTWWWVVVPSPEGLATPAVYRRFDEMLPGRAGHARELRGRRRRAVVRKPRSPRCGAPQRPRGTCHRPATRARRADRARRGRGRPARARVRLQDRRCCSCASPVTTPVPSRTGCRTTTSRRPRGQRPGRRRHRARMMGPE